MKHKRYQSIALAARNGWNLHAILGDRNEVCVLNLGTDPRGDWVANFAGMQAVGQAQAFADKLADKTPPADFFAARREAGKADKHKRPDFYQNFAIHRWIDSEVAFAEAEIKAGRPCPIF